MKLILEHLAPYLPYELKCNVRDSKEVYENVELTGISTKSSYECFDFIDEENDLKAQLSMIHIEDIKPILRPLSGLTSRFEYHFIWENETDIKSIENLYKVDNESLLMNKFSYEFWSLCFENHIDIFGLIEKGLAININEL